MSESDCDKRTTELNIQASSAPMAKREAALAAYYGYNEGEEGATADNMDPSRPFLVLEKFDLKKIDEWDRLRSEFLAKSIPKDIIIPDPTPQWVNDAFYKIAPRLGTILEKDSVRCFLRLFMSEEGMNWDLTITSLTLTHMIGHNALRCVKVALEGKESELNGEHANPNCMNLYGYFPLHEAAEKLSVDMIKLLFRHGASANVRTAGNKVIEDLLPLHVAVENACLHKYLEDNLFPTQDLQDYIYNLIHLLCLPEMKIFLDTIRLLAEQTNNLVDELWNYIKDEKLVQTAVLLLAAQGKIRGGCSSKRNVNGKKNGFHIIMNRIVEHSISLRNKKCENGNTQEQLEEGITLSEAFRLVNIISEAGEDLNKYIQAHSEKPHVEVLEHVSSILKDHGFCPTGEGIDVRNLRPYNCKLSDRESYNKGHVNAAKAVTETAHAAGEKVRKKLPRGWDPEYSRRMFYPYWRSVLGARCHVKVYPSYAPSDAAFCGFDIKELRNYWADSTGNGSSQKPKRNLRVLVKIQRPASNHQSIRPFGTAAFTLLKKVLRK